MPASTYVGRFNGLAIGNEIMVSRVENVLLKPAGPKVHFCYMTTEKRKKWYFVTKIVLTYCEKKLF